MITHSRETYEPTSMVRWHGCFCHGSHWPIEQSYSTSHLCNLGHQFLILLNIPGYHFMFCNWFRDIFLQYTKRKFCEQSIRQPNRSKTATGSNLIKIDWSETGEIGSKLIDFDQILWFQNQYPTQCWDQYKTKICRVGTSMDLFGFAN